MKSKSFLAFDTSNYTTSAAVLSDELELQNSKKLLPVELGKRGLRQSDAVFFHTKQIFEVYESLDTSCVGAVGVSTRPRNVEGSYMPCFLVGKSVAEIVAKTLSVPLYEFSHQQGHIAAGLLSCGREDLFYRPFLAFHLSGGTTELLYVNGIENIKIVADTDDLTAGQLIDRCGVKMGLSFPAGAELEKLASEGKCREKPKICIRAGKVSLSGFENKVVKMLSDGIAEADVAAYVFESVYKNIEAMTDYALKELGNMPVLFVGGVMANKLMRPRLAERYDAEFAAGPLSSDNASGIAYLTLLKVGGKI